MFKYIFKSASHSDTTEQYMQALGMSTEQIESVLQLKEFDDGQYAVLRRAAYAKETDHLYMDAQLEGTEEAEQIWRDKVMEIKARYPNPTL